MIGLEMADLMQVAHIDSVSPRPSRASAEAAVRTLLAWAGDEPGREGLVDSRVVRAFEEYFAGYMVDPAALLARSFEETDGYDEMVREFLAIVRTCGS